MMIIFNYIYRHLAITTIFVLFILVLVNFLPLILKQFQFIIKYGDVENDMRLVLLLMPEYLVTLLPLSFFISSIIVYTRMSSNNEITVLESSGSSNFLHLKILYALAIPIAFIVLFISSVLLPWSKQKILSIYADYNWLTSLTTNNFNKISSGYMLYLHDVDVSHSTAHDVILIKQSDKGVISQDSMILKAQSAELIKLTPNNLLIFYDGNIYQSNQGTHHVVNFETYTLSLPNKTFKSTGVGNFEDAYLWELLDINNHTSLNEIYLRISIPLFVLLSVLLICLFLPVFHHRGRRKYNNIGLFLSYIGYFSVLLYSHSSVKANDTEIWQVYATHLSFFLFSMIGYIFKYSRFKHIKSAPQSSYEGYK